MSSIMEGVVKWWSVPRGFGFIACSDGSDDVFAHVKNFTGIPEIGMRVRFEIATNERNGKLEAINVKPISAANAVGVSTLLNSPISVTKLSDGTVVTKAVL